MIRAGIGSGRKKRNRVTPRVHLSENGEWIRAGGARRSINAGRFYEVAAFTGTVLVFFAPVIQKTNSFITLRWRRLKFGPGGERCGDKSRLLAEVRLPSGQS